MSAMAWTNTSQKAGYISLLRLNFTNMATFERLQLGRNRFVLEQGIALSINGVDDLFVMLGSSLPV